MSNYPTNRASPAMPAYSPWTPERKELAFKLWADGYSATQIARQLACGLSRNAIIGVLHRAGKSGRNAPSRPERVVAPKAPKPERQVRADPVRRAAALHSSSRAKTPPKPRLLIAGSGTVREVAECPPPLVQMRTDAFAPLPGSEPKAWTERRFGQCTWPVGGEGADTLSCCLPEHKDGWCSAHFARGTNPRPVASANEMARGLRRHVGA